MKKMFLLLVVILVIGAGCSGLSKNARNKTHKVLENTAIDWVNF